MNSLWIASSCKDKLLNKQDFEINTKNISPDDVLETDICIIGAGIFGLSCAYYLSKLGHKVTVLEK